MGQRGPLELGVAQIAKPYRLQAGPPEPLTRSGRFDRDERVILKGSEQRPRFRRFLLHVWSLSPDGYAHSPAESPDLSTTSSLWVRKQRVRLTRDYTQCRREATVEKRLKSAIS